MSDYALVGQFDELGFPTGTHVLIEGEEQTVCGRTGEFYPSEGPIQCPECGRLVSEALLIDEPGELL